MKLKPFNLFFKIERVDADARTVDAYAFVNEVVEGEGGIRLKRTAMEAATPDYMEWANVRRMHQADAVGVAKTLDWDDKGARMTLEVVDDDAWNKVQRGVYKGLSVGVAGVVMRGKDVEKCRWIETSLVDRPKDPDAKILAFRAEGVEADAEYDVEVLGEEAPATERSDGPPSFTSAMAAEQMWEEGWEAVDALYSVLCQIAYSEADDKEGLARTSIQQFADYIVPMVSGKAINARSADSAVTRLMALVDSNKQILERAEAAESQLATVRAELSAAKERVTTLERMPDPDAKPPVRYFQGVERTFLANNGEGADARQEARTEIARLSEEAKTADAERRMQIAQRLIVLEAAANARQ